MSELLHAVDRLRRRLQRLIVVRGVCWTLAAALLALLACGAVDAGWRLESPLVRSLGGWLTLAVTLGAAWRTLVHPLSGDWGDVPLALLLERNVPEYRDRLASAIEFLKAPRASSESTTATALRTAAVEAVVGQTDLVRLAPRLAPGPAALAAAVLLAALAAWGGWFSAAPQTAWLALERQVNPFGAAEWPRAVVLELLDERLEPHDDRAARSLAGEPLTVYLANRRGDLPADIRLLRRAAAGEEEPVETVWTSLQLPGRGEARLAVATLTPEEGLLQLRAVGGDDRDMTWQSWTIVPAPRLERFRIRIEPPAYSGLPTTDEQRSVGHVDALIGSQVSILAESAVPLGEVLVRDGDLPAVALPVSTSGTQVEYRFQVESEGRRACSWTVSDPFGMTAARPQRYEIRGRPDAPPQVQLQAPPALLTVTPAARIPLEAECRDDLGLESVVLTPTGGAAPAASSIELWRRAANEAAGGEEARAVRIATVWDLSLLSRQPGDALDYHLEAADRRQPDPQFGRSRTQSLRFVSEAEKRREIQGYEAGLARLLERLELRQSQALQATRDLHTQWSLASCFRPEDEQSLQQLDVERRRLVGDLTDAQTGLTSQLQRIRQELNWNLIRDDAALRRLDRLTAHLKRLVERLAPELLEELATVRRLTPPAGAAPAEAPPASAADDPVSLALGRSVETQAAIASTLEAMLADISAGRRWFDTTRQLQELLAEQQRLREETEAAGRRTLTQSVAELPPQDRANLARIADRQRQLPRGLERLNAAASAPPVDPSEHPDPAPRSTTLPEASLAALSLRMLQAAEHLDANRIGQGLAEQSAILAALSEMLQGLDASAPADPARRLAELQMLQEQAETLRRRQEELRRGLPALRPLSADAGAREQLEFLRKHQQELAQELDQLAVELRRQLLEGPAQSATRAASSGHSAARALQLQQIDRAGGEQEQTLHDLQQLARQLAAEQRMIEQERLRAALAGLSAELQRLSDVERALLEVTLQLEAARIERGRWDRQELRRLTESAASQRDAAANVSRLAVPLADLEVLAAALEQVAGDMLAAAARLDERRTDEPTARLQQASLDRLAGLLAGLEEASAVTPPPGDAQAAAGGDVQDETPTTRLFELRLLRSLQVQLLDRTTVLRETTADREFTPAELELATRLQTEQLQLAERAAELLSESDDSPRPPVQPDPGATP